MKKKILVTGGAGFIGSNLCKSLLDENCHVICLDNLYSGSMDNIKQFSNNNNFEFIKHDVTLPIDIKIDEIYNFACPASPVSYQNNAIKTIKTCVIGAINMLELAIKYDAKIMQASTSEIYGDPTEHPQKESYWGNVNTIGIRSCYDEGKRAAETLMMDYHRQKHARIKIIRIFNTYGPYMQKNDGRVISNFIVQAINNKDITIYGDGSQTRSFCYIDDLINAIIKTMKTEDLFTGPINLGNPDEYTIKELAQKIITLTNSKSKIIFKPLPQDDPKKRKPDISLAKVNLNWQPNIKLDEGLNKTIAYFQKINKKENV